MEFLSYLFPFVLSQDGCQFVDCGIRMCWVYLLLKHGETGNKPVGRDLSWHEKRAGASISEIWIDRKGFERNKISLDYIDWNWL